MNLERLWYRRNLWVWLLWPLSILFWLLSQLRRALFCFGLFRRYRAGVPVIVVGNLTVGGNGKTPVVIWLVEQLRAAGYRPGVISRGYGGKAARYPLRVTDAVSAAECGDEPKLIAERCGCPVAVAPKRARAIECLLADGDVDIIISDDGLQHYALARDLEIVVVDGDRRFGNGHLLPMGPMREGSWRLAHVDAVISNGGLPSVGEYPMQLLADTLQPVLPGNPNPLPQGEVDALAGIGHPPRFFRSLELAGFSLRERVAFADHQPYDADTLARFTDRPLIMTEKDAVKCRAFARENWWYLPVSASLPPGLRRHILTRLKDKGYGIGSQVA